MALNIDYYASLNSPWTHLGAARIEALESEQRNADEMLAKLTADRWAPGAELEAAAKTRRS